MTDDNGPAVGDLVAALLAVRTDHASARFDAELAAAEAAGTIDATTARTLRWWQRESVRALTEHVTTVVPTAVAAVAAADREAQEAVAASAAAWSAAQPVAVPAAKAAGGHSEPVAPPASPFRPADPVEDRGMGTVTELPTRSPDASEGTDGPGQPTRPGPGFTSHLTGPEQRGVVLGTPTSYGPTGAPSPRLLVGGLTVLGDGVVALPAPHDLPTEH